MKHSYHTDIAIQYKLGILDKKMVKFIPASTLHNWKNKDFTSLIGMENGSDFSQNLEMIKVFLAKKHLLQAAKALYFIYLAYVGILKQVKNRKMIFKQSKECIIKTIDQVKEIIGLKRALKAFHISLQQYYGWKNSLPCKTWTSDFCRKIYQNQLSKKEIEIIQEYLKKPVLLHWNITNVFYQMLREKAAFFSRTTFYKYAKRLVLQRTKPEKKNYDIGIRAEASKQMLHMDVTIYKLLDNSKVYLYFMVDNFSRFILNWKASLKYSAEITFQNISEACQTFQLEKLKPFIELVCDGGPENKGAVDVFVNQEQSNLYKLVAKKDIVFSNSMIEAVNKRMKYDFLFTTDLYDIEQTKQFLAWAVEQYNNKPHSALFGLTPREVFQGALPDKNSFKQEINQAAKARRITNLAVNCLNCR